MAAHRRQQAAAARALVLAAAGEGGSFRTGLERLLHAAVEDNDMCHLQAVLWIAAAEGKAGTPASSVLDDVLGNIGLSLLRTAVTRSGAGAGFALVLVKAAPWLATQADSDRQGPLHWLIASWEERHLGLELLQQLVAVPGAASAVDSQGRTPLFLAADLCEQRLRGLDNPVRVLAAAAPETVALPARTGETPVHRAVCSSEAALRALVDLAPAQVAATLTTATGQQTPLQLAIEKGSWDAVAWLLEAVMHASNADGQHGSAAALQLLLQTVKGSAELAVLVNEQCGIMHVAVERPTAAVLQLVLSAQLGNAMEADDYGELPLHAAASHGRTDAVRLLLAAAPAAAATGDYEGWLPLHFAVGRGHAAAVSLLLEAAPLTAAAATHAGWLPLHYAARQGNAEVVRLLLEAYPQAAVVSTPRGTTPLVLALRNQHAESAQLLVGHGSTPKVLAALAAAPPGMQHLFADAVAARLPLNAREWKRVPSPCPGLGRALPAALQHSLAQARQLVRRLPAADAERLQAAALVLVRAQRQQRVHLPGTLIGRILSLVLSDSVNM
jgi:ankyrin repeat protein